MSATPAIRPSTRRVEINVYPPDSSKTPGNSRPLGVIAGIILVAFYAWASSGS